MIDRFEESESPLSAAFGIWNANTVFSLVDLLAITGQSAGTENSTRSTIVNSTRSVAVPVAAENRHVTNARRANDLFDFIG